jgi:hypothetical protein
MSKTVGIILGTLVLVALAVVGAGYWWWQHTAKDFFKDAQSAYIEARKAGASMDEQGCLDKSLAILKTADGQSISGAIRNNVVLKGCLQASKPLAAFCEGVPLKGEIMAGAAWELKTCAGFSANEQEYCKPVVREVPTYCSSPVRAAKLTRSN